jgi:hypothetical protein
MKARAKLVALAVVAGIAGAAASEYRPDATPGPTTAAEVAVDPLAERPNPWSEKVRSMLVIPCGSCHRSTLPTAVPGALLVFDLDKPVWHRPMSGDQAQELRRRAEKLESIDAFDRDDLARFVNCRTGGDCTPPPPQSP